MMLEGGRNRGQAVYGLCLIHGMKPYSDGAWLYRSSRSSYGYTVVRVMVLAQCTHALLHTSTQNTHARTQSGMY